MQEENRMHDAAMRELGERIAELKQQMKPSSTIESIPNETPSEPVQELSEPPQVTSNDINSGEVEGVLQESARALEEVDRTLAQSEVEAPQETTKKKKRNLF